MSDLTAACCVAGGGPAGVMTGYLLARAGVPVTVLEKHADFLRDFRGDTIHPSTLQLMDELGLYDRLLELPHHKVRALSRPVWANGGHVRRFHAFAHPREVPRVDAAVGFPEFSCQGGESLPLFPAPDADRGGGVDPNERENRRRDREIRGWPGARTGSTRHRLRRQARYDTRAIRPSGRGHRCAHGRAVVPAFKGRWRS